MINHNDIIRRGYLDRLNHLSLMAARPPFFPTANGKPYEVSSQKRWDDALETVNDQVAAVNEAMEILAALEELK